MKPFLELATELPKAFAKAEADQKAAEAAAADAAKANAAAKAVYEAALAQSQAKLTVANNVAIESAQYLKTIQTEINSQLGRQFDSRVRQG